MLALLAGPWAGACRAPEVQPEPSRHVRITSGAQGGGARAFGDALAQVFRRGKPGLVVDVQTSTGARANVEAIQAGTADIGFTFADRAYEAAVSAERAGVRDQVRSMAVLQVSPAYLVLRPGLNITQLSELRGRRLGANAQGQAGVTIDLVLHAYDLTRDDLQLSGSTFSDAAAVLLKGDLDAFFVVGGFVNESVVDAVRRGAVIRALRGEPIERLLREYPFFRPAIIPGGTFPGIDEPLQTVGVHTLLVCRRDLDEQLVYDLTSLFFEALPSLAMSQNMLEIADLEQAPASPIPLHPGAARYYRERELTR